MRRLNDISHKYLSHKQHITNSFHGSMSTDQHSDQSTLKGAELWGHWNHKPRPSVWNRWMKTVNSSFLSRRKEAAPALLFCGKGRILKVDSNCTLLPLLAWMGTRNVAQIWTRSKWNSPKCKELRELGIHLPNLKHWLKGHMKTFFSRQNSWKYFTTFKTTKKRFMCKADFCW